MKPARAGLFTALFLAYAAVSVAFLCLTADPIISWVLSHRCGISVHISGLRVVRWREVGFSELRIGEKGGEEWLRARKGRILFPGLEERFQDLRIEVEKITPGAPLLRKSKTFFSWLKAGSPGGMDLTEASILLGRRPEGWSVRLLGAENPRFRAAGAVRLQGKGLRKMDLHLSLAPGVVSSYATKIVRKMIPEKNGWRAADVSLSSSVWMLHGWRGPILRFSGAFVSNSG